MSIPENSFSVKTFIGICREQLSLAFGSRVYVFGKISKINQRNPNLFIELSDLDDKNVALTCFLTATAKQRVTTMLEKGKFQLTNELPVLFYGTTGVFNRNGSIYLNVEGCVVEFTTGKLVAERDKTNERLKKEGLFDRNREQILPFLPRRLLLLTSSAGTVINDFISGLETGRFGFELLWREVPMQGASAKKEVLAALTSLPATLKPDAVLLFRGGGSNTELAVFNDYDIARAICLCPVPVLSAIGHQADLSSAQDVSFLAHGVPKELGLYFANIVLDYRNRLSKNLATISSLSGERLIRFEDRLRLTQQRLTSSLTTAVSFKETLLKVAQREIFNLSRDYIRAQQQRLLTAWTKLSNSATATERVVSAQFENVKIKLRRLTDIIGRAEDKLSFFEKLAAEADPQRQLERGFSVIFETKTTRSIRTVASLTTDKKVDIRLSDGTIEGVQINRRS